MVMALQSNDAEEWAYEFFYAGHGLIATTEGGCRITATLRKTRLMRCRFPCSSSLETLHGTPDRLRLSSGSDLVRMTTSKDAPAAAAGAAAPTAMDEEARGLLRRLVPDVLNFEQAVQAGDARRVAELLSAAGPASSTWPAAPGLLSAAGSRPDLADLLPIDSRLSKRPAAVPLVAAALAGRAEVVEVLLEHQLRSLDRDPWTLACAAACSPRAQAALLARLSADPHLRVDTCPRNHALEVLGMAGCTLVEIAVLAGGAGLARALVSQGGCRHTLATAVQSGDVEWLEHNAGLWRREVDSHFRLGGGVPPPKAGFTPLIAATAQADAAVVKCLLRHGANPYVRRLRVGKGRPYTSTAINYAQARAVSFARSSACSSALLSPLVPSRPAPSCYDYLRTRAMCALIAPHSSLSLPTSLIHPLSSDLSPHSLSLHRSRLLHQRRPGGSNKCLCAGYQAD
jgi:hypothetical protein